ncbi:hypothetical protein [Pseudoalteromonas sp. S16_S37]|uniref:hypothetical protein n=1 Tax=Pseudoalteromonas sp. S16_S37 TaxID=2720228 RepID=UPI00168001E7|nr:hypothetical protein [Pseudoalteromonas sp. S16_S37]MBD1584448.1 hypothetical protein [Pseudoalteromonas sp. S16_S37]
MSALECMLKSAAKHTVLSDPGSMASYFDAVDPRENFQEVIDSVGSIYAQFQRDVMNKGHTIDDSKQHEVDLRYAEAILKHSHSLQPITWRKGTPLSKRVMGVCRDNCLVLVSWLRHYNIPARVRYGFIRHCFNACYPYIDHTIVDYWDEKEQCWKYAEPMLTTEYKQEYSLDLCAWDLPRSEYIGACDAWNMARQDNSKLRQFSGFKFDDLWASIVVRNSVMRDLAASVEYESLLWDCWGYMLKLTYTEEETAQHHALIDQVASLDLQDPEQWLKAIALYQQTPVLQVKNVSSVSPYRGRHPITENVKNLAEESTC